MNSRKIRRTKAWLVKPSTRKEIALKRLGKMLYGVLDVPNRKWFQLEMS